MRLYKITGRGRSRVKVASMQRDFMLDYLYDPSHKTATWDELQVVGGTSASTQLRNLVRQGLVEEVPTNGAV